MKKSELFFSAIQVPLDAIAILVAATTAFWLRDSEMVREVLELKSLLKLVPFDEFLRIVLVAIPFFILVFATQGLYDIRATRKFWQESLKVFSATTIVLMLVVVTFFLKREWFSSRFIILLAWFLVTFYVIIIRFLLQSVQKWLLKNKRIGVHRTLLIGRNGKIDTLRKIIERNPKFGYEIIDVIDTARVTIVKSIREDKGIDEIILSDATIPEDDIEKLIDFCAINNITYRFIPTTLQTAHFEMGVFAGEPIIEIKHTPLDGWNKIIKRIFDIVVSLFFIILTFPILVVVAILIKLEDRGGPIIYKNKRISSHGREIKVFKLRYFQWKYCIDKNNPNFKEALAFEKKLIEERSIRQGPLYKIKDDPRKTKIGTFIEKYSIDEFPQFYNVFLGDLSLVGPRPHQKREVEKYREYHRRLLTIKPGITGMAQVSGRSDLDFEDEYKLDLYYIENWTLLLDIQIIFKTVAVLLRRRKNNS
ncbi:MAG: sugar transferase [Parcubacteria group bacterium]|jgi:exopolysaccharide biosynthesis polyprenyl glycosylphosphotransferase